MIGIWQYSPMSDCAVRAANGVELTVWVTGIENGLSSDVGGLEGVTRTRRKNERKRSQKKKKEKKKEISLMAGMGL